MSSQKTLSRMSFVVIGLLAAALPCLAQTKPTPVPKNNTQTAHVNLRQETEIAALCSEWINVCKHEAGTVSDTNAVERQRELARARFQQSVDEASSATLRFGTTISQSDWEKTRRVGNDNDESSSPMLVTFVPSRGQKLPR